MNAMPMTVDQALLRHNGEDGHPGGPEASADGLGDIADVLAAEVRRLRAELVTVRKQLADVSNGEIDKLLAWANQRPETD